MTESDITEPRIALLIDADNVPPDRIGAIVEDARGQGRLTIRRAFGRLSSLRGREGVLGDLGFAAEATLATTGRRKDTADVALALYAIRIAERRLVEIVAFASSDSDFAPIAQGLAESGVGTIGYGRAGAPAALRHAVGRFVAYDGGEPRKDDASARKEAGRTRAVPGGGDAELRAALRRELDEAFEGRAEVSFGALGQRLTRAFGKDYIGRFDGAGSLQELIGQIDGYRVRAEGRSRKAVRAKGKG